MALKARVGRIPATKPNWASTVSATYTFKTSVLTAAKGVEQREAIRETARLQIRFQSLLREEEYLRHQRDFAGVGQDRLFVLPNPWRLAALNAPSGASTLELDPLPFWAVVGASVVVEDEGNVEAGTISVVAGTTITLQSPLTNVFATGAQVRPAYLARAQETASFAAKTAQVRQGAVQYEIDPTTDPQAAATITPDTFESRDVFLTSPNWARDVTNAFNSARAMLDPSRGNIDVRSPRGFSVSVMKMQYTETTATKAEALLAFFLKMKGKRTSFFMPTWQTDMRSKALAAVATTAMTVDGTEFFDAFDGSQIFNVVYVRYDDGSYQINRIASMVISGTDTVLTMVDAWDSDVPAGKSLSWCPVWRFASDNLKLDWPTSAVAQASVSVQSLISEAP